MKRPTTHQLAVLHNLTQEGVYLSLDYWGDVHWCGLPGERRTWTLNSRTFATLERNGWIEDEAGRITTEAGDRWEYRLSQKGREALEKWS